MCNGRNVISCGIETSAPVVKKFIKIAGIAVDCEIEMNLHATCGGKCAKYSLIISLHSTTESVGIEANFMLGARRTNTIFCMKLPPAKYNVIMNAVFAKKNIEINATGGKRYRIFN